MASSALPQENGDFQTVHTTQDKVLVSSSLLSTSNAATEENSISDVNGSMPSGTLSSPTTSYPNALDDDAVPALKRPLRNVYPELCATTFNSSLSYEDGGMRMTSPQCYASDFLDYEHSQGEPSFAKAQTLDSPYQIDPLRATSNAAGLSFASSPSGMTILSVSSNAAQLSRDSTTRDENNQRIPSYMTPEAIRARNLILYYNCPTSIKKAADTCTSPNVFVCRRTYTLRKRQKMDRDCCNG